MKICKNYNVKEGEEWPYMVMSCVFYMWWYITTFIKTEKLQTYFVIYSNHYEATRK